MQPFLKFFKKAPFFTVLILLAASCALWFYLSPGKFKAVLSHNPVIAEILKEHYLVEQKNKFVSLGFYYPYFPYFAAIVIGSEQPKADRMDAYYAGQPYIFRLYYQKAVEMFPGEDAAHFLLGYCEYYLGKIDDARAQYEKALELNPHFLWSYYNLGVIYFQQGDSFKSARVLAKAFSLKEDSTLEILHKSGFYRQIWLNMVNPSQIAARNLNEARKDALILLADYFIKEGRFDEALLFMHSYQLEEPWHQELWEGLRQKAVRKQREAGDMDRLIGKEIPVRLF